MQLPQDPPAHGEGKHFKAILAQQFPAIGPTYNGAAGPSAAMGPTDLGTSWQSRIGTTPHNLHDCILGKPDVAADQAIRQTVAVHGEDLLRLLVGGALTYLAAQDHAAGLGSLEPTQRVRGGRPVGCDR
jgi:hypothetical protein